MFFQEVKKLIIAQIILTAIISFIFIAIVFKQNTALTKELEKPVEAYQKKMPVITLKEDGLYIDGEKFFIKGVGYSPFRPSKWPGSQIPLDIVEEDFKRIKDAGFNTIRVWSTIPGEQLELAEKYGLKVIQAVALKSAADFGYTGYIRLAESKVRQMSRKGRNHPNIIMYLVMNEPHSESVIESGVDNTLNLYTKLVEIVKKEDPARPVSMANAYWTLWLDQSLWDVISFNTYSYAPSMVSDIGYSNFVKSLKSLHAKGRPFIVTEFGLSVSPRGPGKGGYGGNTEEEQAEGLVKYFRELIRGGAAGGCVFEWNDEWWKAGNADSHDRHAEEWFGIIGIEDRKDRFGKPRKAYHDLKDELRLVITKPKEGQRVLDSADIEICAAPQISELQYRIDEGKRQGLTKAGDWWRGRIDLSNVKPGLHTLTIECSDDSGGKTEMITRQLNIIRCKDENDMLPTVNIELMTDKPSYKTGDIINVKARLTDREGMPLKGHYIKLGVFHSTASYNRDWEGATDKEGFFSKTVPAIGSSEEWFYVYWAATETEDYGYKRKEGKIGYVKAVIGEGFPIKSFTAKKAGRMKIDGEMEEAWLKTEEIDISVDTNFAEGDIDSSDDLSAKCRVLWDSKNIYLLADVRDDIPIENGYVRHDLWKGDCIEFFISVDPEKIPEEGYSPADFQILIGANGNMWIPDQVRGGVRNSAPVKSQAVAKKTETGYILEAKINIANFYDKRVKKLKKGAILGFDIGVGDADAKKEREGKIVWNGTAQGYKDSAVWGRLKLE